MQVMKTRIKALIRTLFFRWASIRFCAGAVAIFNRRSRTFGLSHLWSYEESKAIGPLQREEALALFGIEKRGQ